MRVLKIRISDQGSFRASRQTRFVTLAVQSISGSIKHNAHQRDQSSCIPDSGPRRQQKLQRLAPCYIVYATLEEKEILMTISLKELAAKWFADPEFEALAKSLVAIRA